MYILLCLSQSSQKSPYFFKSFFLLLYFLDVFGNDSFFRYLICNDYLKHNEKKWIPEIVSSGRIYGGITLSLNIPLKYLFERYDIKDTRQRESVVKTAI